jgi:hypothetical protein
MGGGRSSFAIKYPARPSGLTDWSTLAAPIRTSNTAAQNDAALAAIPDGSGLWADQPIDFNYWVLKSNISVYGAGTQLRCLSSDDTNPGALQQSPNFSSQVAINNVNLIGLNFIKPGVGHLTRLYANHFKMKYCRLDAAYGYGFIEGDDVEIGFNVMPKIDCVDGGGIRYMGNGAGVASVDELFPWVYYPQANVTRQARVWIHDNQICSNDAVLQVDQGGAANGAAHDVLFERNIAYNQSGNAILLGGGVGKTEFICIRDMSADHGGYDIRIFHVDIPDGQTGGGIENVLIDNVVMWNGRSAKFPVGGVIGDGATNPFSGAGFGITVSGTANNIHVRNPIIGSTRRGWWWIDGATNVWIENPTIEARRSPVSTGDDSVLKVNNGNGFKLTGGRIDATNASPAVALSNTNGATVTGVTFVSNGTISQTNVTNATISGNTTI